MQCKVIFLKSRCCVGHAKAVFRWAGGHGIFRWVMAPIGGMARHF